VSTSNTTPAGDGHPFGAEKFARQTAWAIEYGDAVAEVTERRVIRLEEIVAARWPRSMVLRWRLRREIRASVATWDPAYIPRDNFYARRLESAGQEADEIAVRQKRARAEGWPEPVRGQAAEGAQQPGEGLLP
jgi:hypothetical protein